MVKSISVIVASVLLSLGLLVARRPPVWCPPPPVRPTPTVTPAGVPEPPPLPDPGE